MTSPSNTAETVGTPKPHDAQPPRQRRRLLLAVALLIVTLVNAAHLLDLQEYLQLSLRRGQSSELDVLGTSYNVRHAPPLPPLCPKFDKSHVDPAFFRDDACFTRDQVLGILKELVFTIVDTFERHNMTYFLDSGTLLGAFRNQSVIAHDIDADVGIDAAALTYLQHHAIEFPSPYFFTVWHSRLYPKSPRDDKLPARLIHKDSGLYVDVFAFLDWHDPETGAALVGPLASWCFDNCVSCPSVKNRGKSLRVPRDWIYPRVNCSFEGRTTLQCPHKTQQYLQYAFGSDYMTPTK